MGRSTHEIRWALITFPYLKRNVRHVMQPPGPHLFASSPAHLRWASSEVSRPLSSRISIDSSWCSPSNQGRWKLSTRQLVENLHKVSPNELEVFWWSDPFWQIKIFSRETLIRSDPFGIQKATVTRRSLKEARTWVFSFFFSYHQSADRSRCFSSFSRFAFLRVFALCSERSLKTHWSSICDH